MAAVQRAINGMVGKESPVTKNGALIKHRGANGMCVIVRMASAVGLRVVSEQRSASREEVATGGAKSACCAHCQNKAWGLKACRAGGACMGHWDREAGARERAGARRGGGAINRRGVGVRSMVQRRSRGGEAPLKRCLSCGGP